jgi:hemolysin D
MNAEAAQHHPANELLARYWAVLSAAWAARHELAGPRRLADEAAFLPAALSLQETPVHPSPRRAMWLIMALFAFATVWSVVGRVDVVAVAPGRIVVSDNTKVIQPLDIAVVKEVKVRDGDRVRAGQVLVRLDSTLSGADRRAVEGRLEAEVAEVSRASALLHAIAGAADGVARPLPVADADPLRAAEWTDITARLGKLAADVARRQAELETGSEGLRKLNETLPLVLQRESDYKSLIAQGFVASHVQQDRTRERIEVERDHAIQHARVKELEAALAEGRQSRAAYIAETRRVLNERLSQATLKSAQLTQESRKIEHKEGQTELRAPVDGVVQQLQVHTTGGVVTSAQPLMVIVPDQADVIAEVKIDNKDVGFVREGQAVAIKVEAFPFTRYGTVPGIVTWVARDAVVDDRTGLAHFPATVRLATREIAVDGKRVSLSPGLNMTAEVMTGRRRLIEFLISPIQKQLSEGLRER